MEFERLLNILIKKIFAEAKILLFTSYKPYTFLFLCFKLLGSKMSDDAEQQAEEVEVLKSIYEGDDNFKAVNSTTYQYKV